MNSRFEICHTGPYQFHARFVAANNETVWVTESYRTHRAAVRACVLLAEALGDHPKVQIVNDGIFIWLNGEAASESGATTFLTRGWFVAVKQVDERGSGA